MTSVTLMKMKFTFVQFFYTQRAFNIGVIDTQVLAAGIT